MYQNYSILDEKEYLFKLIKNTEPKNHLLEYNWASKYTEYLNSVSLFD